MSDPQGGTTAEAQTELRKHPGFESEFLAEPRDLVVYLPPGYDDKADRRHPVVYLHDGQNLSESATAFVPGQDLEVVRMTDPKPRLRIWLDIGTGEGGKHVQNARALRDELVRAGSVLGADVVYAEIPEAGHSETAWAARV